MKRVMSGMLAGLLLLTGTGAIGHAWVGETYGQNQTTDQTSLDTNSSVVNATDMMAAAGLDTDVSLGELSAAPAEESVDTQLWEPEAGIALQSDQGTQDYVYLSNLTFEPESWARHGDVTPNKSHSGGTIQLKVDGEVIPFPHGLGAHAKSEVIYDISKYSDTLTRLSCYMGVDYSQNGKGNGVKFTVSCSEDKSQWRQVYESPVVLASDNAHYVDLNVKGYHYIKLTALDNGADGNDHSVYGDLRLLAPNYDISTEGYAGLDTVAEYDAILSRNSVEDNLANRRDTILRREFVNRMGYNTIQAVVKSQSNVAAALDWLLDDTDALQLFLEAGSLFNGSSGKTLMALGDLYQAAQDDVRDSDDAYTYKKMMLATAVAYCRDIKTYMVNYGGNAVSSDPVEKYTTMKYLYDNGYFARKEEFKTYPMELVRYVMDAKMDDSEILWLRKYTESQCADLDVRINGYTFVNYVNTWYNDAEFYDPDYESVWDAKYGFLEYGVSYGVKNLFRLWMMMEKGGICWGISGMGMNTAEVHGIPAVNTYQPGHEAYLIYSQNDNGDGTWTIWNNVGGWGQSYSRWGDTIATEARLLLGWGCMEYITNYNKNNTTYILLAQAALNDYDRYLESMYANFLAASYPAGSDLHEQALKQCLDKLSFNLDGMYGLIKSYADDTSTTNEEWKALARRVVDKYTYYPAVMVDLLGLITPHFTNNLSVVEVNTWKTQALHAASQATAAESLQPDACREIANSLLGQGVELATFSFDGEHPNSIVLDESYDQYEFMVRYSLDGGATWEKHLIDGEEVSYTPEHIITLTPEQLKRVTAEQDIVVGLMGVDTTHTIDILPGQEVQPSKVYLNDNEDLFIGATDSMEYSVDGGANWQDYKAGLTSSTRFTGEVDVMVRYKAHGVYLQGPKSTYTFHPSTDTPRQTYLQLQHVTLVEFSSQQSTGADHAAANFIDGSGNTTWHTLFNATDDGKFYTVKLDGVRYLSKLAYLPGGQNGRLKSGQIYVSLDGDTWTLAHTFEGLENNTQRKDIVLDTPTEALYVKVVATETYYNTAGERNKYFNGKMLDFYVDTTQTYAPQAQVTYTTQAPTNQDVTATLELP